MTLLASLATCVAIASAHYGVEPNRVDQILRSNQTQDSPDRVGVMGVPDAWLSTLHAYGFDVNKVRTDACENVVAGTWILAATDRAQKAQARWDAEAKHLPQRAVPWQFAVRWVATQSGINPSLLNAVIEQESKFNPHALGPMTKTGERAVGLMQILPSTAKSLGVDPYDPMQNLWGGAWYLSNMIRGYGGNIALALAAYNAGPGAVARYGGIPPYRETREYVPSIILRARRYADATG